MIRLKAYFAGFVAIALTILTFGAFKERKGRKEAIHEFEQEDSERANRVRERVRDAGGVQPSDIIYRD